MELNEAMDKMKVQNSFGIDELEQMLQSFHADHAQRAANASRGAGLIREGLSVLAALGHQFEIVRKSHSVMVVFPKMLYNHASGRVEEKIVESQDELDDALADGWAESPSGQPAAAKTAGKK